MNEQHIVDRYENVGPIVCLQDQRFSDGTFDLEHVLENIMDASYDYVQNKVRLCLAQTGQRDIHQFVNRLRDVGIQEISLDVCEHVPFVVHAYQGEMTNHALVHDEENSVYYHEIEITFDDMNQCDKAPADFIMPARADMKLVINNLIQEKIPLGSRPSYLTLVKG